MNRMRLFKRLTLGAVVITATGKDGDSAVQKVKPSELPIYGEPCKVCKPNPCSDEPSSLECQIGVIRKELWIWNDKFKTLRQEVVDVCETGLRHTESTLDYLKEESNYLPRYGAIAISGLAGVVLGLRGGKIKKLTYGAAASLAMASLCYPREAAEISQESLQHLKKYVQIGYNFIYGVKPDYLSLPDPATFMPDSGADVKKPTDPTKPSMFDQMKASFLDAAAKLTPQPASPVAGVDTKPTTLKAVAAGDTATSRDQSRPEDKDLYTTRT